MRIAIISDIHEDIVNLRKTIDRIIDNNIDKIVCLGDIIGFESNYYNYEDTRSAKACIQLLTEYADIIVTGNHELHATESIPYFNQQIGFPENMYSNSMEYRQANYVHKFFLYKYEAKNDLDITEQEIIKNLDSWKILDVDTKSILFSHFIYPDINGNLKDFSNNKKSFYPHFEWMEKLNINISFVGHAHVEGVGVVNKKSSKIKKFGIYSLNAEPQIILCPCVARGNNKNGFVIFDSENMTLELIKL